MNKRAMELSANFLVVMILSIVIFSSGIYIATKIFDAAGNKQLNIDLETQRQIERLMFDGSRVAIPFNTKKAKNGDLPLFGIGILNVLGEQSDFTIKVEFSKAIDKNNQEITDLDPHPNDWVISASKENVIDDLPLTIDPFLILNNAQKITTIGIELNKVPPGTYIYNVDVNCQSPSPDCTGKYDNTHKIRVEVI
jgi:hypothetical protein